MKRLIEPLELAAFGVGVALGTMLAGGIAGIAAAERWLRIRATRR